MTILSRERLAELAAQANLSEFIKSQGSKMQIVYTCQSLPGTIVKSVFLAGPSLRKGQEHLVSWRKKALSVLDALGYDGVVFVPESEDGNWDELDYKTVNDWETKCLAIADNIIFYINRDVEAGLLGLTTNDEFGFWKTSGKCILCTEPNADSVRYQETWAEKLKIPIYHDLYNGALHVIKLQGDGAERIDGERCVPLYIWEHPGFQSWYGNLRAAGNVLAEAKVEDVFLLPNGKVFSFRLWCNIYIDAEKRYKNNEFFITRNDISSCVLYYPRPDPMETDIIIVKEFRTPGNNKTGYVYEVPGGSSFKPGIDMKETIIEEIHEETGFRLNISKLEFCGNRQLAATMLTHQSHLWAYELDAYELEEMKRLTIGTHGVAADTELTYVEVKKIHQLLADGLLDWSNLGQVLSVVIKKY